MPAEVHPRPQLTRESWGDLGGEWQFTYDDEDRGRDQRWYDDEAPFDRSITVPYPPESAKSGIADTDFHPVMWYRRLLEPPRLTGNQRLLVHFGAVDYEADVWVNGRLVTRHGGGHTPFTCDVTEAVGADGEPVAIVVRAEDQPHDPSQPRGKQDWQPAPHGIWYHRTSGIWQPVWWEVVPDTHITDLHWTSDIANGTVRAEMRVNQPPARPLTLRVTLRYGEEVLAEHTARVTESLTTTDIALPVLRHQRDRGRVLWSPQSPSLIDADVEIRRADDGGGLADEVVDTVSSYLGLRSVGTADGQFLINGHSIYLRSVLAQGYWPESHLAAPDADALRNEVQLIKDLGFNAVRIHQKAEDPRFLYWCDRLGLLVWGEMANAYAFDADAVDRFTREWLDVVRRDRSHPCIVTWVPINESWGVQELETRADQRHYITGLYHLTKSIDPTRPVISNDGWEHTHSDIWTLHDYRQRPRLLRTAYGTREDVADLLANGRTGGGKTVLLLPQLDTGQPVMLTEFGGTTLDVTGEEGVWGYSQVDAPDALVKRIDQLVGAVLDSPVLAGFCYTQLTDTLQEQNGLLTEGRVPKAPIAEIRKAITKPRAVPPPSR